jgi:hypothetical protein
MAEIQYVRIITKSGTGAPTIPPSLSHDNGDWDANDIYENELYVDNSTGKLYTRIGLAIIELTGTAVSQDLQSVTDEGSTTTNSLEVTNGSTEMSYITPIDVMTQNVFAGTLTRIDNTGTLYLKTGAKETALRANNITNHGVLFEFPDVATGSHTIATLDGGGKIPMANLPSAVLKYVSLWNASTNSPALTDPDATKAGNVYVVSVSGTRFGITWNVGDWLIYNDSGVVEKSDNSDDIVSVNGYTGIVVLNATDVGAVPTSRNVTIGGVTQNLSADRTFLLPTEIQLAVSDEVTALSTGTSKITFRMPYAMTVTGVRASLSVAQTSGSILTIDINEGGSSILSTKLTIDNTERTSVTATTAPVISDSSLSDDAEITIDIDQIGDGTAKGLKITIIGTR